MLSRTTGQTLKTEIENIHQSITDILTTPIGSRIMRREYGSKIPELIDQPMNDVLILQLYSAIYTPLLKWENRISIDQIHIYELQSGLLSLGLDAVYLPTNQNINLQIPLRMGAA
ncbi:GPW/gp25 family protein [Acinetobacter sp. HY1485]|uniref:GPW/gp25 family protein n=1 Tax=Acinetobacter sp. HY1485 TaxID=2970918 RepID=UPI0022B9419C|nr:GPW/gp25 family protein [Acinetobacter sp. HY1485]